MEYPGVILIVDDDRNCRESLGDILEYEGYHVAYARNGREALALLSGGSLPDLILLDVVMPSMNGFEFRRHQKQDPVISAIPVIFVTASDVTVEAALVADAYFTKPYQVSELLATIEVLLAVKAGRTRRDCSLS